MTCQEEMKQHWKEKVDIKQDKLKLFALILKYLSRYSLDAVHRGEGWLETKKNVDPEGLWKLVGEKHRVYSTSKIGIVVKLKARMQEQNMRQGIYESVISYKQ